MAVVNTNLAASIAQAALVRNERDLSTAMEQLSTGKKINSAADNASGLAISTRMTSQIRGLDQAVRNANDAISMISTAEGALEEITSMLQRMRELAVQAGTGTTSTEDRDYLNDEYTHLLAEIDRVANNTQWNGRDILDGTAAGSGFGSSVGFQVGMNPSQTISVAFGDFTSANGVMASLNGFTLNSGSSSIASSITAASNVITAADVALEAAVGGDHKRQCSRNSLAGHAHCAKPLTQGTKRAQNAGKTGASVFRGRAITARNTACRSRQRAKLL